MRVPGPIRQVFDTFPIIEWPGEARGAPTEFLEEITLYVPSVGVNNRPQDPESLYAEALLILSQRPFKIQEASPYMTPLEDLPVLGWPGTDRKFMFTRIDSLVSELCEEGKLAPITAQTELLLSVIRGPLQSYWYHEVLATKNSAVVPTLYQTRQDSNMGQPAKYAILRQTRDRLASKISPEIFSNDEGLMERELSRAIRSLAAETSTTTPADQPGVLHLLIYAYSKSAQQAIPDSLLARALQSHLASIAVMVHLKLDGLLMSKQLS